MQLLIDSGANVRYMSSHSFYLALIGASLCGHIDIAQLLLDNGANINMTDDRGDSALTLACEHGHVDIMHLLIDRGANVVRDRDLSLVGACYLRGYDSAKTMLELGANPNSAVVWGVPILSICCNRPVVMEIIELLLEYGADPNRADDNGLTSLHHLLRSYCSDILMISCARKLLDYGADVTIADRNGRTALDLARWEGPELLALYEEYVDRNNRCRLAPEPMLK